MPVKLGFLGFGIMGERLMRAALNHDKKTIIVTGAYDPNPKTRERLSAIDSTISFFATPGDAIAASDCLHIAAPPATHLHYLSQCTDANRSALCEKPLATDVAATTTAIADLKSRNARVGINFPFASSPAVDQVVAWLKDGTIGTPQSIEIDLAFATWPRSWQMDAAGWLDRRPEGGFTREVGSHFLFLSHRMFGPLHLKSATCSYPEDISSERAISATLTAGTIPVRMTGNVGTTTRDDHNTWTLTGTHGRIRLRDWSFAERDVNGTWQGLPDAIPNEKARPLVLARQLDKVAAMARGAPQNLATLDEALNVQVCVEAILKAAPAKS